VSQNGEPKIRGAVVGAGHMGQYHILALAEIWNVELVGVVDVDFDRAQRVAAPYGARAFRDHRELAGLIDFATVAVPTEQHFAVARDLIESGVHVLVEKPMTSTLEEAKKKASLARFHKITNGICRGLDVAKEVEIVDGLALGDTLLLERGRDLIGFAVVHTPGVSEAPTGALYVKYLAIDPVHKRVEHLEQFVAAVEDFGHDLGVQRVIVPVYLRYWLAYSTLVRCGYQTDFTMVRMQKGKQEDYEDPTHLVLDDWR